MWWKRCYRGHKVEMKYVRGKTVPTIYSPNSPPLPNFREDFNPPPKYYYSPFLLPCQLI